MSNRSFLLSWDCTGLESVVEVNYDLLKLEEQEHMLSILTDPKAKGSDTPYAKRLSITLSAMKLRARYNSQRHYEIYLVPVSDGISADEIRTMFENTPQQAADLMRERGTKIYSDRASRNTFVIT